VEELGIIHDVNELPSSHMGTDLDTANDDIIFSYLDLLKERQGYMIAGKQYPINDAVEILSWTLNAPATPVKSYTIEKKTRIKETIAGLEHHSLETDLGKNTIIRAKDGTYINPFLIVIK
jgi:hypothetical protein